MSCMCSVRLPLGLLSSPRLPHILVCVLCSVTPLKTMLESEERPAHTGISCLCISAFLPAQYLGHFVHRDGNPIDSERRQFGINLLWRRGVLCQSRLQVFQDHALVLSHLQGIKGRNKQDAQQLGRVGAKQQQSRLGWCPLATAKPQEQTLLQVEGENTRWPQRHH